MSYEAESRNYRLWCALFNMQTSSRIDTMTDPRCLTENPDGCI